MQKKQIKLLALAISIAVLLLLILYADPQKFVSNIVTSDYRMILVALTISTFNIVVRTLKWKLILEKVGLAGLLPVQLLGVTISNLSPGKVAEPVKSLILKLKTGLPVSATLPSVIWERVIDVAVLLILSFAGLIFFLPLGRNLFLLSLVSSVIFIVVLVCVALFFSNSRFRGRMFILLRRLPVFKRISQNFVETFNKSTVRRKNILFSFSATLVAWILEGFLIHFSLLAVGVDVSPIVLACIFSLATLIGVASALPGGIGSTDVVMVVFLGVLGVEQSLAITGLIIARFVSMWYFNFFGGVSLIYLSRKLKLDFSSVLA